MFRHIAIVGAGQAAEQAVHTLRRNGFTGKLTLVGEEPCLPYQRPPLSKKFLAGALERARLALRPEHFYHEHSVDLMLGRRAVELDGFHNRLLLDDGTLISYDAALLATGSRPRSLTAAGAELGGVHLLRSIADVDRIRSELDGARRLVVIGGGYIGLEVAATTRELGLEVTVLEMTDRVMNRVTCPEVSDFYTNEHQRRGVQILTGARVSALVAGPGNRVRAVLTDDGAEYPADLVIVGVGVTPVDELAVAAGIECANGIVVDEFCRTSLATVYAAGDCTNHPNPHYRRRVRLESVDNAFEQAGTAARNLLGVPTVHDRIPWFWSDQYDLKLIIVGLSQGYDSVIVRGSPTARSFTACYLKDGELIAVDSINTPRDQMAARKLIPSRLRPDPAKLANPTIPLKDTV